MDNKIYSGFTAETDPISGEKVAVPVGGNSSSSESVWGGITGDITEQDDLMYEFDKKLDREHILEISPQHIVTGRIDNHGSINIHSEFKDEADPENNAYSGVEVNSGQMRLYSSDDEKTYGVVIEKDKLMFTSDKRIEVEGGDELETIAYLSDIDDSGGIPASDFKRYMTAIMSGTGNLRSAILSKNNGNPFSCLLAGGTFNDLPVGGVQYPVELEYNGGQTKGGDDGNVILTELHGQRRRFERTLEADDEWANEWKEAGGFEWLYNCTGVNDDVRITELIDRLLRRTMFQNTP